MITDKYYNDLTPEMKEAIDFVDQNILVEYGLVKTHNYMESKEHPVEKAVIFKEEIPMHIKLLMILDKQDKETLKLIHTYLEMVLDIEPKGPQG